VPELRYLTRFPWARKDSGFTLLFEALVMTLDTSMPVGAAARRRGWRANTTPGCAVAAFAGDLIEHGGDPDQITEVCIDMSPAFIKGTTEHLPNAVVTFDKFHAVKIINDAVDQVRRAEQRGQMALL
jgi:transposase